MSKPGSGIRRLRSNISSPREDFKERIKSLFRRFIRNKTDIQTVEDGLRKLRYEKAVILNSEGYIQYSFSGTDSSVYVPHYARNVKDATATHSHPKGRRNFGGTFSYSDVSLLLDSKWSSLRAVSDGQGEGLYILRRGPNARVKEFIKHVKRNEAKWDRKIKKTYEVLKREELTKGRSFNAAMHIAAQKAIGKMHRQLKIIAPQFGFEYVTRKKH